MNKNKEAINYLYASDDNFAKVLGVSLYSLFETNNDNICNVFIISQQISAQNKKRLIAIEKKFNVKDKIKFIEMPSFDELIGEKVDIKRYSASMFSRILIDTLLPKDIKKVIYLDCDTMVVKSLLDMWKYPLNGKIFGAINDYRSIAYQKNLGIKDENCYINSGVLLIDLEKYRKEKMEKLLVDAIKKYNGILEFPDNDAICKIAQDEIKLLPLKFNVTSVFFMTNYQELNRLRKPHIKVSFSEYKDAIENPSIVHFTTCFLMKGRPWIQECNHPLVNHYIEIYKNTKWASEPLSEEVITSKKKIRNIIIKLFPRRIMILGCGIVHSYLKPLFQKSKLKPTRN